MCDTALGNEERKAIIWTRLVGNSLSIVSSLILVVYLIVSGNLHSTKTIFRSIVCLIIAGCLAATTVVSTLIYSLIQEETHEKCSREACQWSRGIYNIWVMCSFCWTTWITVFLFQKTFRLAVRQRQLLLMGIISIVLPVLLTILMWESYCYQDSDRCAFSMPYHSVTWDVIIATVFIINCVGLGLIIRRSMQDDDFHVDSFSDTSRRQRLHQKRVTVRKCIAYIITFILCWGLDLCEVVVLQSMPSCIVIFPLFFTQSVIVSLYGFINSLVYGATFESRPKKSLESLLHNSQ
eukprot:TRINITY_DN705_c0_g1_i9.p1 TRINITY_DN705_c0_g1~~TRINITY_DN705_c0_g1_i9.p1  ORF type:complete len:293 (+),score=33.48 TRINITY_DN705_c0_g1_i9:40-918(+)